MPGGYVRGAIESIPGNEQNAPVLSTKKAFVPIISFQPTIGAQPLTREDELRNLEEPVAALKDIFEPGFSMTVRAYPDILGLILKAMLGDPITTPGDGIITDPDSNPIPTGAHRHVWVAPFGPAGSSPKTMQWDIAYKDQAQFFLAKGAAIGELGLSSPVQGGSQVEVSGPVAYLDDQVDPALTPAYEAISVAPFTRAGLSLPTWLTSTGTHEDFSLAIANPVELTRSMGIASPWPDSVEKANVGTIVVSGSLSQRKLDHDDIIALREATGFAAVARWVSSVPIVSAYRYKLFVAMANCQYLEGDPEELGNKRRHGAQFGFRSTTTSSGSTTLTLVNATPAYDG